MTDHHSQIDDVPAGHCLVAIPVSVGQKLLGVYIGARSWCMDETYIKVKGMWKYLYRAVDKRSRTVNFLLTAMRNMAEAKRFFEKTM